MEILGKIYKRKIVFNYIVELGKKEEIAKVRVKKVKWKKVRRKLKTSNQVVYFPRVTLGQDLRPRNWDPAGAQDEGYNLSEGGVKTNPVSKRRLIHLFSLISFWKACYKLGLYSRALGIQWQNNYKSLSLEIIFWWGKRQNIINKHYYKHDKR